MSLYKISQAQARALADPLLPPHDHLVDRKLPTVSRLILNLHELANLAQLKTNEVSQKQSMKLIIINSTGRHRKAPSEF